MAIWAFDDSKSRFPIVVDVVLQDNLSAQWVARLLVAIARTPSSLSVAVAFASLLDLIRGLIDVQKTGTCSCRHCLVPSKMTLSLLPLDVVP